MDHKKFYARAGITVYVKDRDPESLIKQLDACFGASKIDFAVVFMAEELDHSISYEIPERFWYETAAYFNEKKIYFIYLYTQQRNLPAGKKSKLTKTAVDRIKEIAGKYFIGDMIGETGGKACYFEGYFNGEADFGNIEYIDLKDAKEKYIEYIKSMAVVDKSLGIPSVLAVEATVLSKYNFQGGIDIAASELMPGDPLIILASARGSSKAYKRKWWACHIACEWYGGFRNDDSLKLKRAKLAYYYSFLAGADLIYPESGHSGISSFGDSLNADSELARGYRDIWNEFSDLCHLNGKPSQWPIVKVGIVHGNLDPWTGFGGRAVWSQYNNKDWEYGDAEAGWDYLTRLNRRAEWYDTTVYGDHDMSGHVPYGQYDLVPAEAHPDTFKKYDLLIFLGWNTMDNSIYENIKRYVFEGGRLFISVPHLAVNVNRGEELALINNGNYSDLLGCNVTGRGKKYNCGIKFTEDSLIPGYSYPYVKEGICDPFLASGSINCADIEVTTGRVKAVLADRFFGWKENSQPIIVENRFGKGHTVLLTVWDHPGAKGLHKLMPVLLNSMLSGESCTADIKVLACDKIVYSVYENTGTGYTIYILNTDFDIPENAIIYYYENRLELEIGPCTMRTVYLTKDIACSFCSSKIAADDIIPCDYGIKLKASGKGSSKLDISGSGEILSLKQDGRLIDMEHINKQNRADIRIDGISTLMISMRRIRQ